MTDQDDIAAAQTRAAAAEALPLVDRADVYLREQRALQARLDDAAGRRG